MKSLEHMAVVAVLAATASVAGCGFRLAGSEPLPAALARPYLDLKDPYTDFSREFERQLGSAGAKLQPVREGATAIIEVNKDLVKQTTLAVSANNIPTLYELTYSVTFAVHAGDKPGGKELMAPQTIEVLKDYSFEENALLAKEHEADILRGQMARDLVAIAMHRLANLK
jgi:LPS-assembly lipoprotein